MVFLSKIKICRLDKIQVSIEQIIQLKIIIQ